MFFLPAFNRYSIASDFKAIKNQIDSKKVKNINCLRGCKKGFFFFFHSPAFKEAVSTSLSCERFYEKLLKSEKRFLDLKANLNPLFEFEKFQKVEQKVLSKLSLSELKA